MKDRPIGEIIKERRLKLGLTQEQLAQKLGYKSKSTINKIELGINDISQRKIVRFADALDTTASYLMGWTSNPSKTAVYEHFTDNSYELIRDETRDNSKKVNPFEITSPELDIILAYRNADDLTKSDIRKLLDVEKYS